MSRAPLVAGQRWHAYQIGDQVPCDDGWKFSSINAATLEEVLVHVRPLCGSPEVRAEAWLKLQKGKHAGLLPIYDATEDEQWRFEVYPTPPAIKLRAWGMTHQANAEDVETLVRQLAVAVQAIHADGVVHGNLSVDTIYLPSSEAGLRVFIGGFECATLYGRPDLAPIPVNAFYAPPEAAGLTRHNPGPGLRAWDWWSLGRIIQELVLGRPVLSLLLDRDVSCVTADIKECSEALLQERETDSPRAGAVEKMPPMDERVASLLRGLLSSSPDGRWGWLEVQAWLRRESVRDRYDLNRNDKLFRWRDRPFDVVETAEFFSAEENWSEGVGLLFDLKKEESFIAFVTRELGLVALREQLDALRDFMQVPAWREFPLEVVRTVIAAVSWLQTGAEGRPLLVRGHRVDAKFVRFLLSADGPLDGLALVRAMLAAPFVQLITSRDPETARFLSVLASASSDALASAAKQEWLASEDDASCARVITLAVENEAELLARREGLRGLYACTRNQALETILKAQKPRLRDLILLSFAGGDPERFGFVTQLDWSRDRYMLLRERGQSLAAVIFWRHLERAMHIGPLVFGRWPWVIGVWAALAAGLGWAGPQPWGTLAGLVIAASLIAMRVALCAWQRVGVQRYSQSNDAWTLRSRSSRCEVEARAVLPADMGKSLGALVAELSAINQEIVGLKLDAVPERVRFPFLSRLTTAGSLTSWIVVVGAFIWAGWQQTEISSSEARADFEVAERVAKREAAAIAEARPKVVYTPEERFFTDPRRLYASWSFAEPAHAPELLVRGYTKASPDQAAMALIDAHKLLAPYAPRVVDGVLGVPANTSGGEAGLMLYDAKRGRLLERHIYQLGQLPARSHTWYELNQQKLLYLGEPKSSDQEIWSVDEPILAAPQIEEVVKKSSKSDSGGH